MPGCAAIGCNNRSEKGYSMKCFPRDALLRQIWKEKVGRANWEPSKNSFLCHSHFEPTEWVQTENGKVRLKRDAIPSIFKETSTRKSPKKRRLENRIESSNMLNVTVINVPAIKSEDDNNYTLEYLDDCEHIEDFDPLGNITKDNADYVLTTNVNTNQKAKKNYGLAYRIVSEKDVRGLEKENIIIVSDENNREIGKLIHSNENIIIVADENNEEIGQIIVEDNLSLFGQHSLETDMKIQRDKYDEIEEQLKQICNGEDVAVTLTNRSDESGPTVEARKNTDGGNECATQKDKDIRPATWMEGSKVDIEIPGNKEYLFSIEGSKEINKIITNSPQKRKLSVENNETARKVDNVSHDSLKSRSPLKRQRRTEEDVMRSIERAISELSERTIRSVKNDQSTRSILRISRARKKWDKKQENAHRISSEMINNTFELDESDTVPKKSKFTIKVTGDADDVSEIMEGLDPNSRRRKSKNDEGRNQTLNYIVPEIINKKDLTRIDSRFIEDQEQNVERSVRSNAEFSSEFDSVNFAKGCIAQGDIDGKSRTRNGRSKILRVKRAGRSAIETLFHRNKEFIHTEESDTKNERKNSLDEENERIKMVGWSSEHDDNQSVLFKYFNRSHNRTRMLQQKINAQQEVIEKLTNQLIIYKSLEAKVANLHFQLEIKETEIKALSKKLEEKWQDLPKQDESRCENDRDTTEKTISDLSDKVNRLKEVNKKLSQQISVESQNRKLAHNLKQKDDQIKELNWKLEKASKFLDRAEKNANTYKRKMVSMQTAIRRQKASDEKRNHFQELLIDNAKHEFSEAALLTAMDIKNTCGIKCYQKLIGYNFPLPSLRTLRRRFLREHHTEDDWGDAHQNQDQDQDQNLDQEVVFNSEYQEEPTLIEDSHHNELGDTEVTGTVQDILEEINDTEEMSCSEFGEQILLQLNNDRKFTNT